MRTSWDFFDTLCGRASGVEPWRLFDLIGGAEFRRVRQQAEAQSDKSFDGIYRTFAEITGWPAARVAAMKRAEWEAELACAFPIVENVRRVRPGDLIVTDTYFAEDQVRQLADRIGIPRSVQIVATWAGKWEGTVWQKVDTSGIDRHVGDNPRSDVRQARAAGLNVEHYDRGGLVEPERWAESRGWWEIAGAARAARLQNPHQPGSFESRIWASAASANVPFLYAAAAAVRDFMARDGYSRAMFVARDSILLQRMFRKLYPDVEAEVFWASRQTFREPSPSYVDYAKRSATPGTLFVDLHGSGFSICKFAAAAGVRLPTLLVCRFFRKLPNADDQVDGLCRAKTIRHGTSLEVMNYHDEGRVLDVIDGRPVLDTLEYQAGPVAIQRAATLAGIAAATRPVRSPSPEELSELVQRVDREVAPEIRRQHVVNHPFKQALTDLVKEPAARPGAAEARRPGGELS